MLLTARLTDGTKELFLFDAVIPTVSGIPAGSTDVTYRTDTKEAGILTIKIEECSVASWFFGYWTNTNICRTSWE
jgi:hypothetical protein